MMKKIIGLLFIVLYSVSSNTFFHVSAMGHFFSFQEHGLHGNEAQPCHEGRNISFPQSNDCFDHCMSVYDEFGGIGGVQMYDYGIIDDDLFSQFLVSSFDGVAIPSISYNSIDSSQKSQAGRSVVGQDWKKRE